MFSFSDQSITPAFWTQNSCFLHLQYFTNPNPFKAIMPAVFAKIFVRSYCLLNLFQNRLLMLFIVDCEFKLLLQTKTKSLTWCSGQGIIPLQYPVSLYVCMQVV